LTRRATVATATRRFVGVGLHGGNSAWFEIHPARLVGQGIIFRSHSSGASVRASVDNVVSTNRSTCLGSDDVRVDTVEHLLSALYACGVTDAEVLFEGVELPIGDGSSLPFTELIAAVGLQTYDVSANELTINGEIVVSDGRGAVITAVPSDHFWVAAMIDYTGYSAIGVSAAIYSGEGFRETVAPARTYGFHSELEALRAAGLGKGATLQNVIALEFDGRPDERTPLRMQDELVRHKILDLIGDLSLVQKQIKVGIVAVRPSHSLNVSLSRKLASLGGGLE
jgi:UDP-3-O-[3-hydroxymyristoyl] N-acetylglucosamine deacetylase